MKPYRISIMKGTENRPPRFYFSCHPDDFALYYESVAADIIAYCNSQGVILFNADYTNRFVDEDSVITLETEEERDGFFSSIQMLIVPVTEKLLTSSCPAIEYEIPFAMEHRIPIIPIVFEAGLEDLYEKSIFADLHFISPLSAGGDRIAFVRKLRKALVRNIIQSDIVERIYEEFRPRIFLSYRKKDRRYAQEIIRMIHQNERFRDVGVWYDEYLRENKSFEDSLREEMKKSALFLLVVTPHLLEKNNYVMEKEYPSVSEMEEPIPILPVEMVKTDEQELRLCYRDLPDSVKVYQGEKIHSSIDDILGDAVDKDRSDDPMHCFLIGLSYLDGIMTEVNPELALELITYAAEAGVSEAEDSLVDIYMHGQGVPADLEKGKALTEKYAARAIGRYQSDPSHDNAKTLLHRLDVMIEIAFRENDFDRYEKALAEKAKWAEKIFHRYTRTSILDDYFLAKWGLSQYLILQGRVDEAERLSRGVLEEIKKGWIRASIDQQYRKNKEYIRYKLIEAKLRMAEAYVESCPLDALALATECLHLIRTAEKGTVNATIEYGVWHLIARAQRRQKNYREALSAVDQALRIYDENTDPLLFVQELQLFQNKMDLLLEKVEILGLSKSRENVQLLLDEAGGYSRFCRTEQSESEKVNQYRFFLIGGEYCLHLYEQLLTEPEAIVSSLKQAEEWFEKAEEIMTQHRELIKKLFVLSVDFIRLLYDKSYTAFQLYVHNRDRDERVRAVESVKQAEQMLSEITKNRRNYVSEHLEVKIFELLADIEKEEKGSMYPSEYELKAFDKRFRIAKAEKDALTLKELACVGDLACAIMDGNTPMAERIYQVIGYLYRRYPNSNDFKARFEEATDLMG